MGGDSSKCSVGHKIGIIGNGNSALIINGISFNISRMLEAVAIQTVEHFRSQMIVVHLILGFFMFLLMLATIKYFLSYHQLEKGIISSY